MKLNKDELQRHAEVSKLYGELTALAAFLLDGADGRYREPFVAYLQAVYAGARRCGIALRRHGRRV